MVSSTVITLALIAVFRSWDVVRISPLVWVVVWATGWYYDRYFPKPGEADRD